jgi:hypothetical protein
MSNRTSRITLGVEWLRAFDRQVSGTNGCPGVSSAAAHDAKARTEYVVEKLGHKYPSKGDPQN